MFDRLPESDSVVRVIPAKNILSIWIVPSFSSSLNVFSLVLIGCSVPTGRRDNALPDRSSVSTLAPWNKRSLRTFSLLYCSCSFVNRSPLNAACGNSAMLLSCMSRCVRLVRLRNAPVSTVSILLEFSSRTSRAGRFSKAPGRRLRSSPFSICSMRNSRRSGNVCAADISSTLFSRNIILTTF